MTLNVKLENGNVHRTNLAQIRNWVDVYEHGKYIGSVFKNNCLDLPELNGSSFCMIETQSEHGFRLLVEKINNSDKQNVDVDIKLCYRNPYEL